MLLKIIKKADWQFKFEGLNSFYNFPRTTMIWGFGDIWGLADLGIFGNLGMGSVWSLRESLATDYRLSQMRSLVKPWSTNLCASAALR